MNYQLLRSRVLSCVLVLIMVFGIIGISGEQVLADTGSNSNLSLLSKGGSSQETDPVLLTEDNNVATAILLAPTNPTAVATGAGSIKITWTAVSGAVGYKVFRSTSSVGTFKNVGDTAALSFTDTGLVAGTRYFYKIKAYRMVGTTKEFSSYSAVVYTKPLPSAPTNPIVVSAGYDSVKVSWTAVSGATGYKIMRSSASGGPYEQIKDTTALSFVNTGLSTGTRYFYKIRAYTTVSTGKIFGGYSAIKYAAPVPATPTSLKATTAGSVMIKPTWAEVAGATGYEVFRSLSASSGYTRVATIASPSYLEMGTTGKTYYYKVRAYTTVDETTVYGVLSGYVKVTLTPSTVGTGTRLSPYSGYQNRTLTFQEYSFYEPKTIQLQLLDVIKGAEANAIVHSENQYNQVPAADEEWMLLKYHLKYVSGPDELLYAYDVISGSNFYTTAYNRVSPRSTASLSHSLSPYSIFNVRMYPGGESDIYIGILVKKTLGYPLYQIGVGYDKEQYKTIYKWFQTNPNY